MTVHLISSVAEFNARIERDHGPGAALHPSNRITACGRHGGSLHTTERLDRVTCKVCARVGQR